MGEDGGPTQWRIGSREGDVGTAPVQLGPGGEEAHVPLSCALR